jgi:IclR family transcriptional regulator, acetate operon repressor
MERMTAADSRGAGARTLELLKWIAAGEREFSLKELAERASLAPSSVHRLLDFWVQRDLLERAGPKAYRMGPELFRVASLIVHKYELARVAQPILQELWQQWQETATFCLLNPTSRSAVVAASIPSPHPLKYELTPHSKLSLAWGTLGRSILAHLSAQDRAAVLSHAPRGPLSGKRLPPRRSLDKELDLIRRRGYALLEDPQLNVAGVSAPVFQADTGIIGSLGVVMPATRFGKSVRQHLPVEIVNAARRLSGALGWK